MASAEPLACHHYAALSTKGWRCARRPKISSTLRQFAAVHAGGDDADDGGVTAFVVGYLRHLDRADLAARTPVDLAGVTLEHRRLADRWQPGETMVSVRNPRAHVDGWESPHTVVMMVTDDEPFLVSSVTMALARYDLGIHLVAHPVFRDHRGIGGGFADPVVVEPNGAPSVSLMMLEVDRIADEPTIDALVRRTGLGRRGCPSECCRLAGDARRDGRRR